MAKVIIIKKSGRPRGGMKYHIHMPGGRRLKYSFPRGSTCPFCGGR
jgi:hypothetical protein